MQFMYCVRYADFRKQRETLNGNVQKKEKATRNI